MVDLVDTTDSKSVAFKSVPVQVRPPVPLLEAQELQPPENPLKSETTSEFQEGVMHKQSVQNSHRTSNIVRVLSFISDEKSQVIFVVTPRALSLISR